MNLRSISSRLFAVALLAAPVAGCDFSLTDDTAGEKGVVRFQYSSSSCLLGCGLDRSALQGSMVTVRAKGTAIAQKKPTASLSNAAIGKIANAATSSCSCEAEGSSRSVEPDGTCGDNATKECTLDVDIETTGEGDTKLELKDASGALLDAITVKVRPASRIESTVRAADVDVAPKDGVHVVKLGQKVELRSKVFVADGSEAIFTEHGVSHDYADTTILQRDTKVIVGATDIEYVATGRAGETTITTKATGASSTVRFRVE